jgi:glycolate oxidase FAD binding subunit
MSKLLAARDVQDAEEAVCASLARGEPMEIVAGGTRRAYGRPLSASLLDLSSLSGVSVYQPEELVLTAAPGTPIRTIEQLLGSERQLLGFEPPDFGPLWGAPAGAGTLGGALAFGLGGPRRPSAGAPRDHFLGLKAVNGFGKAFAAGGRVVKNVTGYDVPKLIAGSLGTLAVLTEVTIKVSPAPPQTLTLLLIGLNDGRALEAMTQALNSPAQVSGAAHLPQGLAPAFSAEVSRAGGAVTALRLEGVEPSVRARADHLTGLLGGLFPGLEIAETSGAGLWSSIRDVSPFVADSSHPLWRISTPPSEALAIVRAIATQLDCRYFFDWGGGLLWLECQGGGEDAGAAIVRGAVAAGSAGHAHATLFRGPAMIRERIAPFQPLAPGLAALTGRVKDQFDPQHLFNPGRMYEGI